YLAQFCSTPGVPAPPGMRARARQRANWIIGNCFAQHPGFTIGPRLRTPVGDFDGDGRSELVVWRPTSGSWFFINSLDGATPEVQWGDAADVPVPGDYDGDGVLDVAVWRPTSGTWFTINSSNGVQREVQWGEPNDVPVPADYDGDGVTDIAVWRPRE